MKLENTEILEQVGLAKNEIKVYFALLELRQSTATPIVKRSGIPNSKIYPTLQRLIEKGLVSSVIKKNVKHFQASNPNNIIEYLNRKEEALQEQKDKIKEIIPQILLQRESAQQHQEATVYEGMKGIITVYQNILNTLQKGETYYVVNLGEQDKYAEAKLFFRNYHLKREEKGINVMILTDEKLRPIVQEVFEGFKFCEQRYLDEPMPSSTVIFENKVATILLGERPSAFVIESAQNAEQYKQFFLNLWERASP